MTLTNTEKILRLGVFGTYLGHGIFAIMVKQSWIKYLTLVGFSEPTAQIVLPLIGFMDILVAILVLFWPFRLLLIWATIWAFATALIRPISGESILEFVERTANWVAPLALLFLRKKTKRLLL